MDDIQIHPAEVLEEVKRTDPHLYEAAALRVVNRRLQERLAAAEGQKTPAKKEQTNGKK